MKIKLKIPEKTRSIFLSAKKNVKSEIGIKSTKNKEALSADPTGVTRRPLKKSPKIEISKKFKRPIIAKRNPEKDRAVRMREICFPSLILETTRKNMRI